MRILILSDLHLDTPRGDLKIFDLEDPEKAIESLSGYTEGIDAVIIAGDIFNAVKVDSVPMHLLGKLNEVLKDIPKKYTIRGNHDRGRFSILEDTLGYTALNSTPIEIAEGISISGCDFSDIETHREYLKSATSDILVCHFPMSPFSTFSDSNIDVSECPCKRVVIVGDTHKPGVYTANDSCVISPGCLFPADKTEILSGYAGSAFLLNIGRKYGELDVGLSQIWLNSRSGHDLSAIKDKDELALELESIASSKPFPANLRPVVYVDSTLSDVEHPDLVLIPVRQQVSDTGVTTADFKGLQGEDVDARIRRILSSLYDGDSDKDSLIELTMEMITTDDPQTLISQFIGRV